MKNVWWIEDVDLLAYQARHFPEMQMTPIQFSVPILVPIWMEQGHELNSHVSATNLKLCS